MGYIVVRYLIFILVQRRMDAQLCFRSFSVFALVRDNPSWQPRIHTYNTTGGCSGMAMDWACTLHIIPSPTKPGWQVGDKAAGEASIILLLPSASVPAYLIRYNRVAYSPIDGIYIASI